MNPIKFHIIVFYLKHIFIPYVDLRIKLGIPYIPKNSKYSRERFWTHKNGRESND
jgi:hypothetical protein